MPNRISGYPDGIREIRVIRGLSGGAERLLPNTGPSPQRNRDTEQVLSHSVPFVPLTRKFIPFREDFQAANLMGSWTLACGAVRTAVMVVLPLVVKT